MVRKNTSLASRSWVDSRYVQHKAKEEPFEIKKYDISDVEKLQRWRQEESEVRREGVREGGRDAGRE